MRKRKTSSNNALGKARKKQDNEFYTRMCDIEKELKYYGDELKGKSVYCNCDNPEWSKFWEYFHKNFSKLGITKLISTHYEPDKPTYKLEYIGGDDNNIMAGVKTPLIGDGDFKSEECLAIMDSSDIICTNPPFSIIREFLAVLILHQKKYLFIGPITCYSVQIFFEQIRTNQTQIGYTALDHFITPEGTARNVQCRWYTNIARARYSKIKLELSQRYYMDNGEPFWDVKRRYPHYDDFDAIDVSNLTNVPKDYMGVMGVPITFLDRYSPEQFNLLAVCRPALHGKYLFSRFLIQRVEAEPSNPSEEKIKEETDDFVLSFF